MDTTVEAWRRQMAATAARTVPERLDEWAQLNRGVLYGDALALEVWPDAAAVGR